MQMMVCKRQTDIVDTLCIFVVTMVLFRLYRLGIDCEIRFQKPVEWIILETEKPGFVESETGLLFSKHLY